MVKLGPWHKHAVVGLAGTYMQGTRTGWRCLVFNPTKKSTTESSTTLEDASGKHFITDPRFNSVPCKHNRPSPNTITDGTKLKSQGAGECREAQVHLCTPVRWTLAFQSRIGTTGWKGRQGGSEPASDCFRVVYKERLIAGLIEVVVKSRNNTFPLRFDRLGRLRTINPFPSDAREHLKWTVRHFGKWLYLFAFLSEVWREDFSPSETITVRFGPPASEVNH